MEIILFLAAWYSVGLVGSAITMEFCFRRDGIDIDVQLIIFGLLLALVGPVSLIVGVIFVFRRAAQ